MDGVEVLSGMTRADRSTVSSHSNSVNWYLNHGRDGSRLSNFAGLSVTGYTSDDDYETSVVVTLQTNLNRLSAQARSGTLDFKSIYEKSA